MSGYEWAYNEFHIWVLDEPIDVKQTKDDEYVVTSEGGDKSLTITYSWSNTASDQRMLINHEDLDLGDEFASFLSIIEDFHEKYEGEIGMTVHMPETER